MTTDNLVGRRTDHELRNLISALEPAWNHLDGTLLQPVQDGMISSGGEKVYVQAIEYYDLGAALDRKELQPKTVVEVFGGAYPIGQPWMPLSIDLRVDGHSGLDSFNSIYKPNWPELFGRIQLRIKELGSNGYVIQRISGLRNQRGDFPGSITADKKMELYGVPQF